MRAQPVRAQPIAFARVAAGLSAALTLLGPAAPALADPVGAADGALKLDDQPTAFAHAYVFEVDELPEMSFGDGPTRYYTVLLTDRPLPADLRPSEMLAIQLAFEGKLRGVGVDIDPTTGAVMSGRTMLPAEAHPQFFTVITMGDQPMVVLAEGTEAEGRFSGHVRTPEPMEVVNFQGTPGPTAFTFEARFDAPIVRAPRVREELAGAAAKQSEQAGALRRFVEAIAGKDMAAIKDTLAEGDPMRETLTTQDVEMMNGMLFSEAPGPDEVLAKLSKVYVFDNDTAVVVLTYSPESVSTFPMAFRGGAWKMGQP